MRKLFLLGALAIGSLSVTAQEADVALLDVTEVIVATNEFKEIATTDLPAAVSDTVVNNYPTATINKAYVNEENQYKLEVSLEDGTSGILYADEDGNWLEM